MRPDPQCKISTNDILENSNSMPVKHARPEESISRKRYIQIFKAIVSAIASKGVAALLGLVSLPLAVRYLGPEQYGFWVTITTTVTWITFLDLGIANTLTNAISFAHATGDKNLAARYVTNAVFITSLFSVFTGLVFFAFSPYVDWPAVFKISSNVPSRCVISTIEIAVCLVLIGLPGNLGSKILAGYQELHISNIATSIGSVLSVAALALGVSFRVSMPVLLAVSSGSITLLSTSLLIWTMAVHKPWLRPRLLFIDRKMLRELLGNGSYFLLLQISGLVVFSSDFFVLSHYLGAAAVTPYSVTWKFISLISLLQSFAFPALWPAYAEAFSRRDYSWIRNTYSRMMRGSMALGFGGSIVFLLAGRQIIHFVAGPAAVPSYPLLLAMVLWGIISIFTNVEACLLAALNRTREQGILSLIASLLNLAISISSVRYLGSLGVIGGTIISYLLVLVLPVTFLVHRILKGMPLEMDRETK